MKKTLKSLLCFGACTIGLIGSVNAATVAVGSDTAKAGEKRKVIIELQDTDLSNYKEVRFRLNTSSAYAKIGTVTFNGTTFKIEGNTYTFLANDGLSAGTIGEIEYSTEDGLNSDFTITPVDVVFVKKEANEEGGYDEITTSNGAKIKEGTIKYERPKSTEAYLTALSLSQGTMSPAFDKDTTDYTVQVKDTINTIRINATACAGATRTGTGNQKLEMGENNFEVEVTAEDGTTKKTYNIKVIRGEIAEPSAYLKKLEINNIGVELSPEFDSKNNKYTAKLTKELTKLDFQYETEDPLAKVVIDGNEKFTEGENLITIKVTSSDGKEEQKYEITVTLEKEAEEEKPAPEPSKEEEPKKKNIWLLVGIIAGALAILGGVIFVLFRKKKNDKKKLEEKLPLKRQEGQEETVSNKVIEEARHMDEEEVTKELDKPVSRVSLYDEEKTQKFDNDKLKEYLEQKFGDDEDLDKTKEFNFKDYEQK